MFNVEYEMTSFGATALSVDYFWFINNTLI